MTHWFRNDDEIQFPDTPFPLDTSLALLGRRGSEAHGTYVPPTDPDAIDDRDLMGICIPPAPWLLGWRLWEGAESIKGVWDVVLYDYRKFVRLLCKQNPNVLGMLWLEPEDYLYVGPAGRALIENRDVFRARELATSSFIGYAHGQLHRMTSASEYKGYMGAKRKALVDRFGYDTKNAAHCVRLLHMGIEYLKLGRLVVRRSWDVEMIRSIKRGDWALQSVQKYVESQMAEIRRAESKSVLPESIDENAVEQIVLRALSAERTANV